MQQKKQKIPLRVLVWFIIVVIYIIIFQIWQWLVLARLFETTIYVCYANNTNSTDRTDNGDSGDCNSYIAILSCAFAVFGCVAVIQFCWMLMESFNIKKFDFIQEKNSRLGIRVKELKRALNVNIGRPNNALTPYTALPNERGHLLTRGQLTNYQSVET